MPDNPTGDAPGLEWRPRKTGPAVPYWRAHRNYVKAGYPDKIVNLNALRDDPEALALRCRVLQHQMLLWGDGIRLGRRYDGTFDSLFEVYRTHEDSPFHEGRKDTQRTFEDGAKVFLATFAKSTILGTTALDIKRAYRDWKAPVTKIVKGEEVTGPERLRRAKKCIQSLTPALAFGQALGYPGCGELRSAVLALRWPNPPRRKVALSFEQASAFIDKAIGRGDIPHALAQAIMFECTLRQKDVIGEWIEGEHGGIVALGKSWDRGLVWGTHISRDLILSKETSKNGAAIIYDLKLCPLVMRVLAHIPDEKRIGPVIMQTAAARPFFARYYAAVWREIATEAGIPKDVWNMDSRAGGITEGRDAGARLEDLRHGAGHTTVATTARYDRTTPETTARISQLRTARRQQNENGA